MNHRNQILFLQGSLAVAIASGVFVLLMGGLLLFSQTHGKVAGLIAIHPTGATERGLAPASA